MKRVRGYVTSRPYLDNRVPQHIQNIVIREYCHRNGLEYLLSATEYIMPACYMILEDALNEMGRIDGLVLYSVFLLPRRATHRMRIYHKIIAAGATLHGAVENIVVSCEQDIQRLEDILVLQECMRQLTPQPNNQ